jgi:hypothetical protein
MSIATAVISAGGKRPAQEIPNQNEQRMQEQQMRRACDRRRNERLTAPDRPGRHPLGARPPHTTAISTRLTLGR